MAMSVRAGNSHYKMGEILRRHWNATAKANAVGSDFEATIGQFVLRAPEAIEAVQAQLPDDFPAQVSDAIFEGVMKQARMLRSG
jgi:serine/threonine-protein kinase HipA